jgi:hypothetical protein
LQAICKEVLDYQHIEETGIAQNRTQITIELNLQIFSKFLTGLSLEIFDWNRWNLAIKVIILSQEGVLQLLMQSFKLFILLLKIVESIMRAKLDGEKHFWLLHLINDDLVAYYLSFDLEDYVIYQGETVRSISRIVELNEFKDSRWDLL